MAHPYVLVFHFPAESGLESADIEDDIAEAVGDRGDDPNAPHIVDGNEIGDAIDVFVLSRDPQAAFQLCEPMLRRMGLIGTVVAAYRATEGGKFNVIHPPDFKGAFTH
jgi:hypothetical protein